jgi:phage baseplate assembly protein W
MAVGRTGRFVMADKPVAARIRFLLAFRTGERLRIPEYGTRLEELEQATDDIEVLAPAQLLVLRAALMRYIRDVRLLGVSMDRRSTERRIEYAVAYEVPGTREVRRAAVEERV